MRAYALLAFALLCSTAFAQLTGTGKAQISIPKVKGTLQLDVGGPWAAQVRADGKETQLTAMPRADRINLTAFLQRVDFAACAEKCRAEWWSSTAKNKKFKRANERQFESGEIAIVEYSVPEYQGIRVDQGSLHAYLGNRDLCAEVHISKLQFGPRDQKLFDDIVATIKLLPDESGTEDGQSAASLQSFEEGSRLYQEHNYKGAAKSYQKALDLEKQHRTLDATFFRVLVDNLGMSYGIPGKLTEAKAVYEYGISQDASYPMFYYLLACTYGEMGKMDESLDQLRLAYKFKANVIAGESVPDPLQDDSFRKFTKNEEFVKAVREMQKQ